MQNKGNVAGGGYYSLKDAERKESFMFPPALFAEGLFRGYRAPFALFAVGYFAAQPPLQQVLGDMLERMGQGDFSPTPSKDCERNCPAAEICRFRVLTRNREEEDPNG